MLGTVVLIHRQMLIVRLEDGCWCVIKPLGHYDVMIGDRLSGNLNEKGCCEILNIDHNEKMNVDILDVAKYLPLIPKDY